MIRRLLLFALSLQMPMGGITGNRAAGLAYVNGAAVYCHGTITTCAATYSPAAGNLVVTDIYTEGSGTSVTATTDNATGGSTTYSAGIASTNAGGSYYVAEYYSCNVKSGVSTITANSASTTGIAIIITEYSGGLTSSCFDSASAKNTGSSNTPTANSLTPASSTNEVISGFCFNTTNNTYTNSGSFLIRQQFTDTVQGNQVGVTSQIVASTSGSYTPVMGIAVSVSWICYGSAYK